MLCTTEYMNIVYCFNHLTKLLWNELNELKFFKLVGNEFHIKGPE